MASLRRMLWLLACLVVGMAAAQSASPTNTSTYHPTNPAHTIFMITQGSLKYSVDPLIHSAWASLGHSGNTREGWAGNLTLTEPGRPYSFKNPNTIAYISCDPSTYSTGNLPQSTLVRSAIDAQIAGIVFFSLRQNLCQWNGGGVNGGVGNFTYLYTMTKVTDSQGLYEALLAAKGMRSPAIITTELAYNNAKNPPNGGYSFGQNQPSTEVAMIILYSITGVITALFLIIIITGAIRAHRHPERYGPRPIGGVARQSRARGIARAMLDTIPVVKFGEKTPEKPADVEDGVMMQDVSRTRDAEIATDGTTGERRRQEGAAGDESAQEEADATTEGESSRTGADTAQHEEAGLGCSICTEDFEKGQDLRVLPCNHKFHPACVDPWLLDVSGTCPLCRVDLRPAGTDESGTNPDGLPSDPNAPLPPPLDPNGTTSQEVPPSWRRRDVLLRMLFNQRQMANVSADERIAALRQFHEEHRRRSASGQPSANESSDGAAAAAAAEEEEQRDRRRWSRVRTMVRRGR